MNKRKLLTLAMTLCMVAILAIGGTLAYFTDSEKATNVLTAGNVNIDLEEYTRDENGDKVAFDDDVALPLYPKTDAQGYDATKSNKIVDVHNVSKTEPAYIRTIVAFEKLDSESVEGLANIENELHYLALTSNDYAANGIYGVEIEDAYWGDVTIGTEEYEIFVFDTLDKVAVPAGSKVQSLQNVWLDKDFTMDHMQLLEDGKVNVLVVAQAVQTANFADYDAAFEATFPLTEEKIVGWFEAADTAKINGDDDAQ